MGYIEEILVPGETVLYRTRYHWVVLIWLLLAGVLLGGLGLALLVGGIGANQKEGWHSAAIVVGLILLVVASALVAAGIIRRNSTEMVVSNKRVLIKTGVVARKSIEVMLSKVESIGVEETVLGRILGYGNVIVRGTGGTFESFSRIAHPNEFRKQVQQQLGSSEAR